MQMNLFWYLTKKKNSANIGRDTSASYTEEDNTMIGLEGYIHTDSLNHIDLEKEKENHIHQEKNQCNR